MKKKYKKKTLTMARFPIPVTKAFKDKRRRKRGQEKLILKKDFDSSAIQKD